MLISAAMFKARVGNDYRSGFPVLATMGWNLVFKGRCFLPEKEQTQTDFRTQINTWLNGDSLASQFANTSGQKTFSFTSILLPHLLYPSLPKERR